MKKKSTTSIIFGILLLFIAGACGNSNKNSSDKGGSAKDGTVSEELISPDKIDIANPFTIPELQEAVFGWKNKTITVTGHCDFFWDKGKIGKSVGLKISPDKESPKLVQCEMKKEYNEEFDRSVPVTIKGEFESDYFGKYIILKNCEVIKKGEKVAGKGYVHPKAYTGENISVKDFYDSYYGWMDKEVAVVGYYYATTTSTNSYGKTIRVDLKDEEDGNVKIGCRMKNAPPENLKDQRSGVIIKGIFKGEAFGNLLLEECEIINR